MEGNVGCTLVSRASTVMLPRTDASVSSCRCRRTSRRYWASSGSHRSPTFIASAFPIANDSGSSFSVGSASSFTGLPTVSSTSLVGYAIPHGFPERASTSSKAVSVRTRAPLRSCTQREWRAGNDELRNLARDIRRFASGLRPARVSARRCHGTLSPDDSGVRRLLPRRDLGGMPRRLDRGELLCRGASARTAIGGARAAVTVSSYRRGERESRSTPACGKHSKGEAIVRRRFPARGPRPPVGGAAERREAEPHIASPEEITSVLFSSGTTGTPKAIPWTHVTPLEMRDGCSFPSRRPPRRRRLVAHQHRMDDGPLAHLRKPSESFDDGAL